MAAVMIVSSAGCSSSGGRAQTTPHDAEQASTTTDPSFSGEGSTRFCSEARLVDERLGKLLASGEQQSARNLYEPAQQAVNALAEVAAPEIEADLAVLVKAYKDLLDGLKKVDYDVTKLPPGLIRTMSSGEVRIAGDRLKAYQTKVCALPG